jgi:hypothetical protein
MNLPLPYLKGIGFKAVGLSNGKEILTVTSKAQT